MPEQRRLLRIRGLQERVAEEALIAVRASLRRGEALFDQLRESGQAVPRHRLLNLLAGDHEAAITDEQTGHQLQASAHRLRAHLGRQRELETALSSAYLAARGERRKLEILCDAQKQADLDRERGQQQRQLDDRYLESGRRRQRT